MLNLLPPDVECNSSCRCRRCMFDPVAINWNPIPDEDRRMFWAISVIVAAALAAAFVVITFTPIKYAPRLHHYDFQNPKNLSDPLDADGNFASRWAPFARHPCEDVPWLNKYCV